MNRKEMRDAAAEVFSVLFDPKEFVWATDRIQRVFSIPQNLALNRFVGLDSESGIYMGLNGCAQQGLRRCSQNVNTYRNILVEFDGIPLIDQLEFIDSGVVPFSACTYSGGKSYHFWISLTEPLESIESYKDVFSRIRCKLEGKNDRACSDPGRWTRMPNGLRRGVAQHVVAVRERVDTKTLLALLPPGDIDSKKVISPPHRIQRPKFYREEPPRVGSHSRINLLTRYLDGLGVLHSNTTFVACPICRKEGRDRHGDNLHISGTEMVFHCFSGGNEHDSQILIELRDIMERQSANSLEEILGIVPELKKTAKHQKTGDI